MPQLFGINYHSGSWGGLPDLGLTEKIGAALGVRQNSGTGGTGLSNIIARTPNPVIPSVNNSINYSANPNAGYSPYNILGTQTTRVTGGGGTPPPMAPTSNGVGQVNQQLDTGNSLIEQDYQNYLAELNNQESNLRSQAPITQQGIEASYAPAITSFQQQGQEKVGALNSQQQQVQNTQASQLQQARDLFRQTQQQNVAQLSGLGISSSSVSEALAEKLGVETARRIASISGNATDVLNNINTERINAQNYVKDRISAIEQEKGARIADVNQQLMNGLNQINLARQMAETNKAKLRYDLLSQAQAQVAQLAQQAQDFQQKLTQWNSDNQTKLANVANYDWVSYFQNAAQNAPAINNYWNQFTSQGIQPSVSIPTAGGARITLSPTKKPEDQGGVTPLYPTNSSYGGS